MAVYTHISEDDLREFLSHYDAGDLIAYSGISEGIENSNYRVETDVGKYVLTLFEKRVAPEDLPFFITLVSYMNEKGIPCPRVIKTRSGISVAEIHGKPCVMMSFIEGKWPRHVSRHEAGEAGSVLASMHTAGKNFPLRRKNALSLPAWKSLIHAVGVRADELEEGLSALLESELDYLKAHWPKYLPRGAVHADFFPNNVLFENGKVAGVIDFYFAATDIFAYDLMLAYNPWCFDNGVFMPDRAEAFLDAYRVKRPLTKTEEANLSFFGRAAAVRIIATRLYDWFNPVENALVQPLDPLEHVRILKHHIEMAKNA